MPNHAPRRSMLIGALAAAAAGAGTVVLPTLADASGAVSGTASAATPASHGGSPRNRTPPHRRGAAPAARWQPALRQRPRPASPADGAVRHAVWPPARTRSSSCWGAPTRGYRPRSSSTRASATPSTTGSPGNVVDDLLLGSIEYAVEHFAPPVLMVLGHENCGAVVATIEMIESGGQRARPRRRDRRHAAPRHRTGVDPTRRQSGQRRAGQRRRPGEGPGRSQRRGAREGRGWRARRGPARATTWTRPRVTVLT